MNDLKDKLILGVKEISRMDVRWDENLFGSAIDSMSLVKIVNLVDDLAREYHRKVDLDSLISEDTLSLQDIYQVLENGK